MTKDVRFFKGVLFFKPSKYIGGKRKKSWGWFVDPNSINMRMKCAFCNNIVENISEKNAKKQRWFRGNPICDRCRQILEIIEKYGFDVDSEGWEIPARFKAVKKIIKLWKKI